MDVGRAVRWVRLNHFDVANSRLQRFGNHLNTGRAHDHRQDDDRYRLESSSTWNVRSGRDAAQSRGFTLRVHERIASFDCACGPEEDDTGSEIHAAINHGGNNRQRMRNDRRDDFDYEQTLNERRVLHAREKSEYSRH